jgi:hypothetical protein
MMESNHVALPHVILTDRDLASMNAVARVFAGVPSMICRWHMNRNVLTKTHQILGQTRVADPRPWEDKFENSPATSSFMAVYYEAIQSVSETEFNVNCSRLQSLNATLAVYLQNHWWKYKEHMVRSD